MKGAIVELAQEKVFKEHPHLESFSWTQFTPHYNDGDPCVFSARRGIIWLDGKGPYDEVDLDLHDLGEEDKARWGAVFEFLDGISNADFLAAFGDHCKVTLYRDNTAVEPYKHE